MLFACTVPAALAAPGVDRQVAPAPCNVKSGGRAVADWPQRRLNFQQVWPITRGAGVVVAVIDSGLNTGVNTTNPQLKHLHVLPGTDVIGPPFKSYDTRDCYGHGTAVAGIVAAQPVDGQSFLGVAPDATILPIKQTNTQDDKTGTADGLAAGIDFAIKQHARVANISVTVTSPGTLLPAAMRRAQAAGMVIVAAAGNDGSTSNLAAYPAAYSTRFDNVIAVSATDSSDQVAQFSDAGKFVTVAAPGVNVPTPARVGYYTSTGTSFAAPYVTGTVALMLAANRSMTASQVVSRIKATADPPPTSASSRTYGSGVINPYLAVTAVRDDGGASPSPTRAAALPAPVADKPASRHQQHVALAAALVLLGLTVLVLAGAAALRGPRRRNATG